MGRRPGSEPKLLWLWCRLAVAAPIRPLAWKLPYATGAALKRPKKKKKKERERERKVGSSDLRKIPRASGLGHY